MKFKMSILVILLSTATLIGVISLVLNGAASSSSIKKDITDIKNINNLKNRPKVDEEQEEDDLHSDLMNGYQKAPEQPDLEKKDERNQPLAKSVEPVKDGEELSREDIQKINGVANMTEAELTKELSSLKASIEAEDLFGKLENGELLGEGEARAKDILERFALIGLEGTRRKYMGIEPELRDPLQAHKQSLQEIREFLNE